MINILKYRLTNYIYFLILEYLYITDYNRYVKILCKSINKNRDEKNQRIKILEKDLKDNENTINEKEKLLKDLEKELNSIFDENNNQKIFTIKLDDSQRIIYINEDLVLSLFLCFLCKITCNNFFDMILLI